MKSTPSAKKHQQDNDLKDQRENPYSNGVLIGNWFEERFAHKSDRKAISPAIYGTSNCMKDTSTQRSDYKRHIIERNADDYGDFTKWKQQAFHNRLTCEQTNIELSNGDQFNENLTTLKDLMYRILPEQDVYYNVLLPTRKKFDFDFMKSYGSQTKTGLLKWQQCERLKEERTPIDMSHYKNNFKAYKIEPKRCRYKGPQMKTQFWSD